MEDFFRGSTAVITGAASGIGREAALELARRGASLALCDINGEGLRETRARAEALDVKVFSEVVDVSKAWQVQEFRDHAVKELGRPDILVNNAGIVIAGFLQDISLEDWERIVGVNFWGVVNCCHFFYPLMAAAGSGHIVNVASVAAQFPFPLMTPYCTTKSAVLAFSESLRLEASVQGVRVTAVCPGAAATGIVGTMKLCSRPRTVSTEEMVVRLNRFFQKDRWPATRISDAIIRALCSDPAVVTVGMEARLLAFFHWFSRRLTDAVLRLQVRLSFKKVWGPRRDYDSQD